MSFLDNFSLDNIKELIKESNSYSDFFNKINMSPNSGSNRLLLSQYIKYHCIDTSHFPTSSQGKYTDDEVFNENSIVPQKVVRKRYRKGEYSPYKCAICGLDPFWNGQPLTLTLDHINGKNNDNRLSNLRWVCPNCNRQLPTFGSRKTKKQYFCKICGCELPRKNKTLTCQKCRTSKNRCIDCGGIIKKESLRCVSCCNKNRIQESIKAKLNKEDVRSFLKDIIRNKSFKLITRENNISLQTLRRWCKFYNLPSTKSEINSILDEEWQNI